MKLIAMVITHNEFDRYLVECIESLQTFCDEIRVLDDSSTDDSLFWLGNQERVEVMQNDGPSFFAHEGHARQTLLQFAMQGQPTHILAIDADEFISDGQKLRAVMEEPAPRGVWALQMQEVWKVEKDKILIRQDGGWREHPVGIAFWVPPDVWANRQLRRQWRIPDRQLACGRTPVMVTHNANRSNQGVPSGTEILHFGWACESDRDARYQRYVTHDSGKFHANSHLESIMWPDERVTLSERPWPEGVDKKTLLTRCNR